MAIETYIRKPAGLKHPVTKYRVRIRTEIDGETFTVDERYDTLSEAHAAHERHWLSIRTGKASDALAETLKRLVPYLIESLHILQVSVLDCHCPYLPQACNQP